MRDDRLRLTDILEAVNLILSFQSGHDRSDLTKNLLLQSGFLHQLYVIGEAAARLSQGLKDKYPATPWRAIYSFRNYVAHEYFSLDLDIVWQTVTEDVPLLKSQVEAILRQEFP